MSLSLDRIARQRHGDQKWKNASPSWRAIWLRYWRSFNAWTKKLMTTKSGPTSVTGSMPNIERKLKTRGRSDESLLGSLQSLSPSSQWQPERSGGLFRLRSLCILAMFDMPKPRAAAWFLAAALVGAAFPLAGWVYHSWPVPNPVIFIEHKQEWTADGRWRVTSAFEIKDRCAISAVRRFSEDGDNVRLPVASYSGDQIGTRPYLVFTRPGPRREAWYEYEGVEPGMTYLLEITVWQCDGGFERDVLGWPIEVELRADKGPAP